MVYTYEAYILDLDLRQKNHCKRICSCSGRSGHPRRILFLRTSACIFQRYTRLALRMDLLLNKNPPCTVLQGMDFR